MNLYIKKAFINGRRLFGTPLTSNPRGYRTVQVGLEIVEIVGQEMMPKHHFSSQDYFFDRELLTDGDPPNDRGCRACGKVQINNFQPIFLNLRLFWSLLQIGHLVADCPRKKAADNRKRQEKDRRERQNQEAQRMEEQSSGKRRDRQSQDRVRRLFPDNRLS